MSLLGVGIGTGKFFLVKFTWRWVLDVYLGKFIRGKFCLHVYSQKVSISIESWFFLPYYKLSIFPVLTNEHLYCCRKLFYKDIFLVLKLVSIINSTLSSHHLHL